MIVGVEWCVLRFEVLDGFRGFFVLMMTITHVHYLTGAPLGAWTHHSIGFVEDAQGFVLLSGFVVGLVYARILGERGPVALGGAMRRRMIEIYRHQLFLLAVMLSAALAYSGAAAPLLLDGMAAAPFAYTGAAALLLAAPPMVDILPMYLMLMILTPAMLRAFEAGRARQVAILSFLCWLAAQIHLVMLVRLALNRWLAGKGSALELEMYFDPLGWQVIYVLGLWAGWRMVRRDFELAAFFGPRSGLWATLAFATAAGFAVFDIALRQSPAESPLLRILTDRQAFSPVHALNFAADLYLICWLLTRDPARVSRPLGALIRGLRWALSRQWLTMAGRHSLHAYTASAIASIVTGVIAFEYPVGPHLGNLMCLIAAFGVLAVTWARDRKRKAGAVARRRLAETA